MPKKNQSKLPEYFVFKNMHYRCENPTHIGWKYYGARGISVDPEWDTFANFIKDMGRRPADKPTLDRRDSNGNYCRANCRWTTWKTQHNNRTNNRRLTYRNQTLSLQQWADKTGISRDCLKRRLGSGWSVSEILNTPVRAYKKSA